MPALLSTHLHKGVEEGVAEDSREVEYLQWFLVFAAFIEQDYFHYLIVGLACPDMFFVTQFGLRRIFLIGALVFF